MSRSTNTIMLSLLLGSAAFVGSMIPAQAWTNDTPAGASQCKSVGVNSFGAAVMNCLVGDARAVFLKVGGTTTRLPALPATAGGAPCSAIGVIDARADAAKVVGSCNDANNLSQAVTWSVASPTSAPTQLMPDAGSYSPLFTEATRFDGSGNVVGFLEDTAHVATRNPLVWSSTGVPSRIGTVIYQQASCFPSGVNDTPQPSVVGNCGAYFNLQTPVWWSTFDGNISGLLNPSGGKKCVARDINFSRQITGVCLIGSGTTAASKAVVWNTPEASPRIRPQVLQTVNGVSAKSTPAGINDNGVVACNYQDSAGLFQPCVWNTAGGNSNALPITLPAAAKQGTTIAIGQNGKIVGNFETADGTQHPFHVPAGGTTAVDDGTPGGGPNTSGTAMSKDGTIETAVSESPKQANLAETQPVP